MGFVIMSGVGSKVTVPRTGTPLSTFAEGSLIKINENSSPVEFYVAKHNYEQELNGAGRTLVVRKNCYDNRVWNSSGINAYASSTIDEWLNGAYKYLLDPAIQTLLGTTKFKYTIGGGDLTVDTLERAIFLLSPAELGRPYGNKEGTSLSIADAIRIALLNGNDTTYWTRSPELTNTAISYYVDWRGDVTFSGCTDSRSSRPCFTLPSNIKIDDSGLVVA